MTPAERFRRRVHRHEYFHAMNVKHATDELGRSIQNTPVTTISGRQG
jgi:hypothetical protein